MWFAPNFSNQEVLLGQQNRKKDTARIMRLYSVVS